MNFSPRWRSSISMPSDWRRLRSRYGNESRIPDELETKQKSGTWYQAILYGTTDSTNSAEDQARHPRSDAVCALLLVLIMLASGATVLFFQVRTWPQQTDSYTTDDPMDNVRGGLNYTCGCSLPANLQSPKNPEEQTTAVNMCYDPSKLETVTVLMFSDSMAETIIHGILQENASTPILSKTVDDGFNVTQEAHDITLEVESNATARAVVNEALAPLYLGGVPQLNAYPTVEYLQSSSFLDFPNAYMRMTWIYDCSNCTTCGLDLVNNLTVDGVLINETAWVSCFYYGYDADRCSSNDSYTAKCVLYPPEELPAIFAVQGFLQALQGLPGIRNIRDVVGNNGAFGPDVQLDPSILYLNISRAESSSVRLSFVEVVKGSVIWAGLLMNFLTLDECTNLSPVLVCNSTSICNSYKRAEGPFLRCLPEFTNYTNCSTLAGYGLLSPDNVEYLFQQGEIRSEIVCPKEMNCVNSAPYLVLWNRSERAQYDPLNNFLFSTFLYGEWALRSGPCTNTYEDVFRYDQPASEAAGVGADEKVTMFFKSSCTNATSTQPSYCWLTGYYHTLSDNPGVNWTLLGDELFSSSGNRFACYRVDSQEFKGWFINTFGVLFSWIGTFQLVFYAFFNFVFVPLRRHLLDPKVKPLEQEHSRDTHLLLDAKVNPLEGNTRDFEMTAR